MDKRVTTKLACPRTLARLPLFGAANPAAPTRMLSMVEVHDFLYHSLWMEDAKSFVANNPNASLRELQIYISSLCETNPDLAESGSYIWGGHGFAPVKRALHEDAAGSFFVKHDNKWKPVFPIDRFGSLIGTNYEDLKPINGYFCPDLGRVGRPHTI